MVLTQGNSLKETTGLPRHLHHDEIVAFCPKCKAVETLVLTEGRLARTRKYLQQEGEIFHDCGSVKSCRLFRPI